MPIDLTEIPRQFKTILGTIVSTEIPRQGWTSNVVILKTSTGPYVIKRANHPLYKDWLIKEAEILQALNSSELSTPTFYDLYTTEDETWVLMSYIDGVPLRQAILETNDRSQLIADFGKTLRNIHTTQFPAGLDSSINWLDHQLEIAEKNHHKYGSDGTLELLEELKANKPTPVKQTLIHGDFTVDNVLVKDNKIVAIIDWSGGAIGDPRYDLALAIRPKEGIFEDEKDKEIFFAAYGTVPITDEEYKYFEEGLYEFF